MYFLYIKFPRNYFRYDHLYLSIFIISKIGILNCLIEDQVTVFSVEDNFSTWYLKKSACLHQVLLCNQTTGNYQLKIYILQLIIFLKIFCQKNPIIIPLSKFCFRMLVFFALKRSFICIAKLRYFLFKGINHYSTLSTQAIHVQQR